MKSLYKYILEVLDPGSYKDGGFTAGGKKSNRILLFDLDETLLSSVAKVYVYKNGNIIRELTPEQYNHDILKHGEHYDYKDFDDFDTLLKSIMLPYWNTLKREYKKGTHIGILTARSDIKMIRSFFLKKGIDIKEDLIFAIGDESLNLTSKSIEERKAECIKRLFEVGYRTFVFFDDNQNNLDSAEELEMELPIDIITVKA